MLDNFVFELLLHLPEFRSECLDLTVSVAQLAVERVDLKSEWHGYIHEEGTGYRGDISFQPRDIWSVGSPARWQ